jgi:hypothetical protein
VTGPARPGSAFEEENLKKVTSLCAGVLLVSVLACLSISSGCRSNASAAARINGLQIGVSYPKELGPGPFDGRMLLMIANNDRREPRFQISSRNDDAQPIFGIDVEGLKPGEEAVFDAGVFGFPVDSLAEIPPGEYVVQALLHKYETFHLADGRTLKLPMDRGEGQMWNIAPGNLISTPRRIRIVPSRDGMIHLTLDKTIPPFPEEQDTKFIKHIKIQSRRLTEFWGRPMFLGAVILLPAGFEEHPDVHYPLMVYQGHFSRKFDALVGFREEAPAANATSENAASPGVWGEYFRNYDRYSYEFYKAWTSPGFPRMILVTIQHANPYFDDSYAVNSSNLGPYGDAITYELVPYIEQRYRGIGQGWARTLYGGSTGGWESLAAQIFYPDEYNGTWTFCPDPIDFRAYSLVNIYSDKNAYVRDGDWKHTPRPAFRNEIGEVLSTNAETNHLELVLGTHGRSGYQYDIWQAVFGPVGDDGYAKPIWDKKTGVLDPSVAAYWREHYDLRYILERDWKTLGPKLKGKIHIYTGDMDNWYLNNAVYLMETFLKSTKEPHYDGTVEYGDRQPHCWCGGPELSLPVSMLTINQRFAFEMAAHMVKTAPRGADVTGWLY